MNDFTDEELAWFRRPLTTALLVLAACIPFWGSCARLQHVDPRPRPSEVAARSTVKLEISCADEDTTWIPTRTATGVVVSERDVLTAAHAVRCPVLPRIRATFRDGRWFRLLVVRDEGMFGDGRDIARLTLATDEFFDLGVAPPRLGRGVPGSMATVWTWRGPVVGEFLLLKNTIRHDVPGTESGDSGSGIYNEHGELTGIVITNGTGTVSAPGGNTEHDITGLAPVDASWLEGT